MTKATRGACFATRREGGADLRACLFHAEAVQFLHQLGHRLGDDRQPVRVMIAPRAERVDEIGQHRRVAVGMRTLIQPLGELQWRSRAAPPRSARKARAATARSTGVFGCLVVRARRRFFENDVRIRTAEAEGIHAHHARAVGLRERLERGGHAQLQALEVDVRIGLCKMEIGRNLPVLEHEHRLDQTRDARGGFQVAEVRFHRADEQRGCGWAIGAQGLRERVGLDRIAHGGAGAVRFDEADLATARCPHRRRRRARAAPAPPGSAARCRWCGRPDSAPCRRSRRGSGRRPRSPATGA